MSGGPGRGRRTGRRQGKGKDPEARNRPATLWNSSPREERWQKWYLSDDLLPEWEKPRTPRVLAWRWDIIYLFGSLFYPLISSLAPCLA